MWVGGWEEGVELGGATGDKERLQKSELASAQRREIKGGGKDPSSLKARIVFSTGVPTQSC